MLDEGVEGGLVVERLLLLKHCRVDLGPLLDRHHGALGVVEEHCFGEALVDHAANLVGEILRQGDGVVDLDRPRTLRPHGEPDRTLFADHEHPAPTASASASPAAIKGATTCSRTKVSLRPVMKAMGTPAATSFTRSPGMLGCTIDRVTGEAIGPSMSRSSPRGSIVMPSSCPTPHGSRKTAPKPWFRGGLLICTSR